MFGDKGAATLGAAFLFSSGLLDWKNQIRRIMHDPPFSWVALSVETQRKVKPVAKNADQVTP